jgi:hypothetical protein
MGFWIGKPVTKATLVDPRDQWMRNHQCAHRARNAEHLPNSRQLGPFSGTTLFRDGPFSGTDPFQGRTEVPLMSPRARALTLTQAKASSPCAYRIRSDEGQDVLPALGEFPSCPVFCVSHLRRCFCSLGVVSSRIVSFLHPRQTVGSEYYGSRVFEPGKKFG